MMNGTSWDNLKFQKKNLVRRPIELITKSMSFCILNFEKIKNLIPNFVNYSANNHFYEWNGQFITMMVGRVSITTK